MSLDLTKLKMVRRLEGGIVQAQCPACAEGSHDRTGNHLRVYPDGKFGCCVNPKDSEHRKRIFALVGDRKPGTFGVRLRHSAGTAAVQSVKAALANFGPRTIRTVETELENGVRGVRLQPVTADSDNSRTPRTGISELRARAREDSTTHIDIGAGSQEKLKDLESGVRGVREGREAVPPIVTGEKLPYFTPGGTLVIPHDSPERFHWWKNGMHVWETRAEVMRRMSENQGEEKNAVTV